MAAKSIVIFIQALLFQVVFGQAILSSNVGGNSRIDNTVVISSGNSGAGNGLGMAGNGIGMSANGLGMVSNNLAGNAAMMSSGPYVNLAAISAGGYFPITSYSPIAPNGMSVISDNTIEGSLLVNGQLPFLSAVAFEGALNTDGQGAASCGCGSGSVGIVSENYGPSLGLGGIARGIGRF